MEHLFNVESDESTAELEELLKDDKIGSTMYNKRWVINLVLKVVGEDNERVLEDFSSLAEMTVDPDVASFLLTSGSLDMIVNNTFHKAEISKLSALLLSNAVASDQVLNYVINQDNYLQIPIILLFAESADVIINFFKYYRNILLKCIAIYEDDDDEEEDEKDSKINERISKIFKLFIQQDIYERLGYILCCSTNQELILKFGRFFLTLVELNCEAGNEEMTKYSSAEFIQSAVEALKQSSECQHSVFVLVEILGHLINEDSLNDENTAANLLNELEEIINNYIDINDELRLGDCLDMTSIIAKLCACGWKFIRHDNTFQQLSKIHSKLIIIKDDNNYIALCHNLNTALQTFIMKYQ